MPIYNKLVRDQIPKIIEQTGKNFTTRTLNEHEYLAELNKKMYEELTEYEEASCKEETIEELADLLELVYAAANAHGTSVEKLEEIRIEKSEKRGGFKDRVFLIEVEDE